MPSWSPSATHICRATKPGEMSRYCWRRVAGVTLTWERVIPLLAFDYRVIAVEPPALGDSRPTTRYDMQSIATLFRCRSSKRSSDFRPGAERRSRRGGDGTAPVPRAGAAPLNDRSGIGCRSLAPLYTRAPKTLRKDSKGFELLKGCRVAAKQHRIVGTKRYRTRQPEGSAKVPKSSNICLRSVSPSALGPIGGPGY
jgi:hypothetical protein